MPKLTPITKAKRIARAMSVLSHMFEGMTQKEACQLVGMHPKTYRRWISRNKGGMEAFRELIEAVERQNFAMIAASQRRELENILQSAKDPDIKISDLLRIAKYLDAKQEKLTNRYNVQSRGDDKASKYLEELITDREGQDCEKSIVITDS